jgi:hypothetical protein
MKERIDQIVDRRVNQLLQKVADGEPVSQEEFDAVKRLAGLADLAATAHSKRLSIWPITVAAALTLALVTGLLFWRVSSTEIELEAKLSEISFSVTSRQAILGTQNFLSLGADGLQDVRLPQASSGAPRALAAVSGELCNAEISLPEKPSSPGAVSLNALAVPAGTTITVTYPAANRISLVLKPPPSERLDVELSVRGSVRAIAHCPTQTVNEEDAYGSPQLIELVGASSAPLALQITLLPETTLAFSSQMGVADLSLFQVDQLVEGTTALARKVSSLLSGVLYLESLNGKQMALRPYEELRFAGSTGVIRKLVLSPPAGSEEGSIALHAYANVQGMTIGTQRNVRSLMPTFLEWLSTRQSVALLWGSTLYLTGLLASMLRWLKVSR